MLHSGDLVLKALLMVVLADEVKAGNATVVAELASVLLTRQTGAVEDLAALTAAMVREGR